MASLLPEVYSRVVGYLRPVNQWNEGKVEEFNARKTFKPREVRRTMGQARGFAGHRGERGISCALLQPRRTTPVIIAPTDDSAECTGEKRKYVSGPATGRGHSDPLDHAQRRQIATSTKLGPALAVNDQSSPGAARSCGPPPHRLQVNGSTSYTWAISLAHVERLSLSETAYIASAS